MSELQLDLIVEALTDTAMDEEMRLQLGTKSGPNSDAHTDVNGTDGNEDARIQRDPRRFHYAEDYNLLEHNCHR